MSAEVKIGYKLTEVGVIPEDWDVKSFAEIGNIKTGPFGTLLKASEYYAVEGVPLVSVRDIGEGKLTFDEYTPLVPILIVRRMPEYVLNDGDIVFGRKGGVDRSAIVQKHQVGCFLGSDGIRVRPSKVYHALFIAYQLQRKEIQAWLLKNATGTTMPSMNQAILRRISLPIPTKVEQEAIAEVLIDADALIESLKQLITKKRQIKQGAMQELLTGKKRLPGFSGEWEGKKLGDIAVFLKGKGLPKSLLQPFSAEPCIHYGELFTLYAETIREVISRTDYSIGCFRSLANDVLMPTSDVTPRGLAKSSCIPIDDVILGGDILVIRPDVTLIYGPFLSAVIRLEENQVLQLVTGTTVFHLYGSDMKKFVFDLPSLAEQISIVEILSDMDAEIAALEIKLKKMRQIKQGMMHNLLTGNIRLV